MDDSFWGQLKHFKRSEFVDPDRMGWDFLFWLDDVRDVAGVPIRITSTVRTGAGNDACGGAQNSAHLDPICRAADLSWPVDFLQGEQDHWRWCVLRAVVLSNHECAYGPCTRVGVYRDHLHVDMTAKEFGGSRVGEVVWLGL